MESETRTIPFIKMHGAGNDYVYVDCFHNPAPAEPERLSIQISDRHKGIGADGLILIRPPETATADARMQMFNADGSESEMCGNGIRCVAKYLFDHRIAPREKLLIETGAGTLAVDVQLEQGRVKTACVDMGQPILEPDQIPTRLAAGSQRAIQQPLEVDGQQLLATCVSMGNPHCVIFVDNATHELVHTIGPKIERHTLFPARVNVEFVEVISPTEVRQRTWERGSGETLACGTGASAVCVAGVLTGKTERKITNHLLGGTLILEWQESDHHVLMTGPAEEVFSGNWPIR